MGNPRVAAVCTRCGFERLHYTRASGSLVRPCMMCSRSLAAERAKAKKDDQDYREKRRQQWARYNETDKGRARLRRHRKLRQAARERDSEVQPALPEAQPTPDNASSSQPRTTPRKRRRMKPTDGFPPA